MRFVTPRFGRPSDSGVGFFGVVTVARRRVAFAES